jgi:ADP-ribose pyrophosphatase
MRASRRAVFKGRLFRVFKGRKKLPNGRTAYFEEVDHPGAALVVPFIRDKIVFIRQYRGVIGKYIWELPAGTLDPGETPYACAKREVAEETGYRVKDIRRIGLIYSTPGFCNERIYIFKARCEGRKEKPKLSDELIKTKQLTRREVLKLFRKGSINDAKTIAALGFAGIL